MSFWFEDFTVGRQMRHARSATIDEVENNFITKQVMNTAQGTLERGGHARLADG
jgi:hypothetical protein